MGTINQIFSSAKSFFKTKPKKNIKTINQVNEVPAIATPRFKKFKPKGKGKIRPFSRGASVIKMAARCNKTYMNQLF